MSEEKTPEGDTKEQGKQTPETKVEPKKEEKPEATFKQEDVERIVAERLARERKKFSDYDDLKKAANQSKPLQEQLDALTAQLAAREAADVEKNGRLALAQVHTLLADNGIKREDVKGVLDRFDPVQLLADGQPDEKAIGEFATALSRVAGRAAPDFDQGKKGGEPSDMNSMIRRMAGRT
jgi:hypothetical protein